MKVLGTSNPADLMTKYLTREKVDNAVDKMGQVMQTGRADSSLDIQGNVNHIEKEGKSTTADGARASSAEADYGTTEGRKVIRIHSRPRSPLCAATAKDTDADSLGPIRTTEMTDQAGNVSILHDYWRASRRPQRHQPFKWTGTTTFHHGE